MWCEPLPSLERSFLGLLVPTLAGSHLLLWLIGERWELAAPAEAQEPP